MRQARGGVLVVGGGFAGGYVARLLGRHGATIVSPENFMLYTPMLPEAASGTLEPRHTVVMTTGEDGADLLDVLQLLVDTGVEVEAVREISPAHDEPEPT